MGPSIARRLVSSSLLILAGFLGLAGIALDRAYRASAETAVRQQLQAHVYTLLSAAGEDEQGRMRLPDALTAPAFNQPDSGLYAEVEGETGAYRWRSASLLGRKQRLVTPSRPGETRFRLSGQLAVFDQGIAWDDDYGESVPYSLTVAMDRQALNAQQTEFRETLWLWLGGVALVLLGAQVVLVRWGLAPLRDMSAAVRRIEHGDSRRIDGPVPLELKSLTDNLNSLIQQNSARQERVRNSLADLAHSMKTPLAVLRGAAEQLGQSALRSQIDDQVQRIDQMVSYQRQRAAVAGTSGISHPVLLAPILRRICATLDKVHRDRGLRCKLQVPDGLTLRADEGDLFELFGNLLENAYKHCRHQVQVTVHSQVRLLQASIEDDGDGIASEDRQRLLRRGERADQRHPGEGIGLAVASEIVELYGGTLHIDNSVLGGASLQLVLPAVIPDRTAATG